LVKQAVIDNRQPSLAWSKIEDRATDFEKVLADVIMGSFPATFKDDQVALLVSQCYFESSVSIMSVLVIRLFQDICVDELELLQSLKQV
jgi:hypothetical protein